MAWYWNGCVWYDGVMVLGFGFSYPEIEIMVGFEHDLSPLLFICNCITARARARLVGEGKSTGLFNSCRVQLIVERVWHTCPRRTPTILLSSKASSIVDGNRVGLEDLGIFT